MKIKRECKMILKFVGSHFYFTENELYKMHSFENAFQDNQWQHAFHIIENVWNAFCIEDSDMGLINYSLSHNSPTNKGA